MLVYSAHTHKFCFEKYKHAQKTCNSADWIMSFSRLIAEIRIFSYEYSVDWIVKFSRLNFVFVHIFKISGKFSNDSVGWLFYSDGWIPITAIFWRDTSLQRRETIFDFNRYNHFSSPKQTTFDTLYIATSFLNQTIILT